MTVALDKTIIEISELLIARQWRMATAESCTGGWIAQQATRFSGSSEWFECGFVTYSNEAKKRMLGVKRKTLTKHGAVSEQVVQDMVSGALRKASTQIAVAVSGVAGPTGGTLDKPVGTVWLGWGSQLGQEEEAEIFTECFHFQGTRQAIRRKSVVAAFDGLLELLKKIQDH